MLGEGDRRWKGLATGGLAVEVERWRAEPRQGDIAVVGAMLAREAAALQLIDIVSSGVVYLGYRVAR